MLSSKLVAEDVSFSARDVCGSRSLDWKTGHWGTCTCPQSSGAMKFMFSSLSRPFSSFVPCRFFQGPRLISLDKTRLFKLFGFICLSKYPAHISVRAKVTLATSLNNLFSEAENAECSDMLESVPAVDPVYAKPIAGPSWATCLFGNRSIRNHLSGSNWNSRIEKYRL